jgi:hypothetical protein
VVPRNRDYASGGICGFTGKETAMVKVPPEETLRQLRDHLEVLAAQMPQQKQWARDHYALIDELMLSFFDMFPGFIPRLREAQFVSPACESALKTLEQHFQSMRAKTEVGDPLWVDWELVASSPDWQQVRDLATEALKLLGPGSQPTHRVSSS